MKRGEHLRTSPSSVGYYSGSRSFESLLRTSVTKKHVQNISQFTKKYLNLRRQ